MNSRLLQKLKTDAQRLDDKSLYICCIIFSIVSGFMCLVNIFSKSLTMAYITGGICILIILNVIVFLMQKKRTHLIISLLASAYFLMFYFLVSGGEDGFSIVWLLLVPPATTYFFSLYYGGGVTILLGLTTILYMWTPLNQLGYIYSDTYRLRFPIVYMFDAFLCIVIQYRLMLSRQEQDLLIERVEHANRTKSDFLANMSHEIRTPMNAIVGMCELILREQSLSENVRDHCFNIQSSSRSLLSIINDILDFSKIESGKTEIIETEFNIASTLNDTLNMIMTRKGNKKIELVVQADPDIPCKLVGDEVRIRQVMINLMTNAVKFTQSGVVTLKVSHTKQTYGINLKVVVTDTGMGITEENLEKLFNSFQQVDTRKNRSIEGTGLGLAICKQLVLKMGGFINVSSVYGKGSTFSFVIPLKVNDPEPFIRIKDSDSLSAVAYINLAKFTIPSIRQSYRELMDQMSRQLKIGLIHTESLSALQDALMANNITHCFIGKEEYLENKDYFLELSSRISVILIQDITDAVSVPTNIRCMYKPFYTMSAASALNNEKLSYSINQHKDSSISFSAPKARVLIVDDNAINLKVAVGLMQPYHMQLLTVESGKAALSMLHSKDIDLVFMDHMMPEMDGVETTRIIRNTEGDYYRNLPVIALTANAVSGVREMFIQSGFNDFIAKPIELSALDRVLKHWLPNQYIMPPSSEQPAENTSMDKDSNIIREGEYISVSSGLTYAGDNMEVYYEILDMYVRKGIEKQKYIRELFENKDWKNYTIEVHALKSTSQSIGSNVLSELAKKLELAGKAGDYGVIETQNEELLSLYEKVIKEGRDILNQRTSSTTGADTTDDAIFAGDTNQSTSEQIEISPNKLTDLISELSTYCSNFDGDEIIRVATEAASYSYEGKSLQTYFDKISEYASDFEYDKALEELNHLANALDIGKEEI